MSIQSIASQVQNAEQYKIRSSKSEQAQQKAQNQSEIQPVKTDEYDKINPVGEKVEGIYTVSHDDEGNLKVNYTQPAEKSSQSESKAESKTQARNESEKPSGAGAGGGTSQANSSSDEDDEIEELKKQEAQLKAQLNRETDEETKQALRVQIQNIEAQIALKSAGLNS